MDAIARVGVQPPELEATARRKRKKEKLCAALLLQVQQLVSQRQLHGVTRNTTDGHPPLDSSSTPAEEREAGADDDAWVRRRLLCLAIALQQPKNQPASVQTLID